MTGTWPLIFSLTESSRAWSWAGVTEGASSSMVLLWRPSSLRKRRRVNAHAFMVTGGIAQCAGDVPGCGPVSEKVFRNSGDQMLTYGTGREACFYQRTMKPPLISVCWDSHPSVAACGRTSSPSPPPRAPPDPPAQVRPRSARRPARAWSPSAPGRLQ